MITDAVHNVLIEGLITADYECDYQPNITYDEVKQIIAQYDGLIINSKILVDRDFIDNAPKLKFVARLGSGREVVDIPYAESNGIQVYFSPEGNSNAVAEHALGMLLALANNLIVADAEVRQKVWNREANRGFELRGLTIGIIGFGHTGTAFTQKLSALDMNILSYDKYKSGYSESIPYITETTLEEIQTKADIISFHLPLTPETKHYCDEAFLQKCQKSVIIINTSRGNVVKTAALIEGLATQKIRGACLDVFENEKVNTFNENEAAMYEKLYQYRNVVLSPHIAGWTQESKYLLGKVLLDKILFGHNK